MLRLFSSRLNFETRYWLLFGSVLFLIVCYLSWLHSILYNYLMNNTKFKIQSHCSEGFYLVGSSGSHNHCDCSSFVDSPECWCDCSYSGRQGGGERKPWWTHADWWRLLPTGYVTGTLTWNYIELYGFFSNLHLGFMFPRKRRTYLIHSDQYQIKISLNICFVLVDIWRGKERG